MAVYFETSKAQDLLDRFDARISQKEKKGRITSWEKSEDGKIFYDKAGEWRQEGMVQAVTENDRLVFNIVKSQNQNISTTAYGYYHGAPDRDVFEPLRPELQ